MYDDFLRELKTQNTYIVQDEKEQEMLIEALFPQGKTNISLVGQPVSKIAANSRDPGSPNTVMLAVPVNGDDVKIPCGAKNVPGGSSLYV